MKEDVAISAVNPVVSVLLAVRDGGNVLGDAIQSVLDQSYLEFELVVVDDGSSDGTSAFLDELNTKGLKLKVLRNHTSIGLTRSLNLGLQYATGKYIARIDHDDVWGPEKLKKQLAFLESHPEVGLLGTAYKEMSMDGLSMRDALLPFCQSDSEIRRALYQYNPFFHSAIVVRRDLLQSVGGYNERFIYAQDYELWVRLLCHSKAANLPEVLCFRRTGELNISFRKNKEQRLNALRAKLLWARLNGFSLDVLGPVLRDLAVVCFPEFFTRIVRGKLHGLGRQC